MFRCEINRKGELQQKLETEREYFKVLDAQTSEKKKPGISV